MKIGIRLECLGLPLRRALTEAARMGVGGVQFDAVGDLGPNQLSQTGRRELRNLLRAHNLELSAIGSPMRSGLDVPEALEARIDYLRDVMSLSFDLGPRIVVVQAGHVREDDKDRGAALLRESLLALGHHGDRVGVTLALETGLEDGAALCAYLEHFDTGSLGVNFDPANLLINGFDPHAAAHALVSRIVHAHAKDARKVSANRAAAEVALGHGDIDWLRLLDDLKATEYRGYLTVERESGGQGVAEIEAGVKFLRRLVA